MERYIKELTEQLRNLDLARIKQLANKIKETSANAGTVFILGNGGSAATSNHWVCDLSKGTIKDMTDDSAPRIRAKSLSDNIAIITALANDFSYEEIFVQQMKNLAKKGDLLIIMSASGNSKNVTKAIRFAKEFGVYVFSLLGSDGGEALKISDNYILTSSKNYGVIEDIHLAIGHMVTEIIRGDNNLIS